MVVAILYVHGTFGSVLRGVPYGGIAAGWAGALGGVAISLKGVYEHGVGPQAKGKPAPWDNDLFIWHLGRPFSGIIVGLAVFILLKTAYPSGNPSPAAMAAAAFILGTQEKRFFAWIKQIGAVVVAVPKTNSGPADNADVTPPRIDNQHNAPTS